MSFAVLTPTGVPDGSGGFGRLRTERLELAPGDYTLRLSRSGALVREVPFTIAGETLRLTVEP